METNDGIGQLQNIENLSEQLETELADTIKTHEDCEEMTTECSVNTKEESNKQVSLEIDDRWDAIGSSEFEVRPVNVDQVDSLDVASKNDDFENFQTFNNEPISANIESCVVEGSVQLGSSQVQSHSGVKDSYEDQFQKFLQQTHNIDSQMVSKEILDGNNESSTTGNNGKKTQGFEHTGSDETSNSSWYKMSDGHMEKMELEVSGSMLPPDECSNLSMVENGSVASSNIGDSFMSFQDQVSNMDECSNLSITEDSLAAYSGHQPVFDESANMNPPSNAEFARPDTPSSIKDLDSEGTPAKRFRRGTLQIAAEDATEHGHGLKASDIFEYQWPQEADAEFYMLQEQISIFLDIKSFKRKYPDLFRRNCDKQEKDFLREKGVVSETQSDLGLTALKADEVHDLMGKDYPAKYKEFIKILHEREKQKMADKMKEFHALKLEKDKMIEYTKKAMKSVSDWNRNLLKEKNEERRAYFDMQTFTFQYPKNKYRKLNQISTEVTAYPLALIPGQFQDYHKKYTSEELKYFPLNTALFDPPKKMDPNAEQTVEDETDSQADDKATQSGSDSNDSSSSSSDDENAKLKENAVTSKKVRKDKSSSREVSKEKSAEPHTFQPLVKQESNECRICKDDKDDTPKASVVEELIKCSECRSQGHPSCLDLTEDMVQVIKTYPWQCMECKTCVQCMDPYDEDKMLFCDKCDRGYHTFCVGLKSLPTGSWACTTCKGDTTPVKPIPKPIPKRRGRKPKDPNVKGTPGRKKKIKIEPQAKEVKFHRKDLSVEKTKDIPLDTATGVPAENTKHMSMEIVKTKSSSNGIPNTEL